MWLIYAMRLHGRKLEGGIFTLFKCMCVHVCASLCVLTEAKKVSDPLELEPGEVMHHPIRVLEINVGSSGETARAAEPLEALGTGSLTLHLYFKKDLALQHWLL